MLLSQKQIEELLAQNSLQGTVIVEQIKEHNHIYRLDLEHTTGYLKIYTKDWYGDDVKTTGYCVDHEVAAWRTLYTHGLATPEVLLSDTSVNNALRRPFVLSRALSGHSLTTLAESGNEVEFQAQVTAIGRYLASMHKISFPYPGYVTSTEPNKPLEQNQWQHPIWTFEQFQRTARQTWKDDCKTVSIELMEEVDDFYERHASDLKKVYSNPSFVHGDCHASQFFLDEKAGRWDVTGVVDMEVASAGDSGADFVKFGIEMTALFTPDTRWWNFLFEGYGVEPEFDLIKLRLLATDHASYQWIWKGAREQILKHILTASSWHDLYDLRRLHD